MKTGVFSLAIFCIIFTFTQAQDAPACNIGDLITKLRPLTEDPDLSACSTDSGYDFVPPTGLPTEEQITKMCEAQSCKNLATKAMEKDLPNCVFTYQGNSINPKQAIEGLAQKCGLAAPNGTRRFFRA